MVENMEDSERGDAAEDYSEAVKQHQNGAVQRIPFADVEAGSTSTEEPDGLGTPTATTSKDRDGSVVSAMTDFVSLEGPMVRAMLAEEETASDESCELLEDHDVPKQVILPESSSAQRSNNDSSSPPLPQSPSPTNETPMALIPSPDRITIAANLANETFSLPERHQPRQEKKSQCSDRSVTTEIDAATAGRADSMLSRQPLEDDDGGMDDYIRSPEVQNAIVERSPGGRYVRFMEKLGSGASKDVYRAYDTQEGIEVAWNVVNLSGVPKAERNRIVNEVRLLERLHHQNIISFHGSWVNRERQEVNFVTEILSSGTLKKFINKVQVIRWKIAKRWALQILKGLEYLHSQEPSVIHRDLKCENIFINGTSGDLRIGDLGLSTVHRNGRVLSVLGTPEFMAPDMYEENSYDEKVDVYAFGMCLLEIFTKEIPYSECNNPAQIYKKVSAGEPPEVLSRLQSKHARDFVMLCLGYRDEDGHYIRPTVAELLQHPFLVKRANDDDEVVVDPPLREHTIAEVSIESMSGTPIVRQKASMANVSSHSLQYNSLMKSRDPSQHGESVSANDSSPPQVRKRLPSGSRDEEDDGDRFQEMQESEIRMRKVKVLMGRGQELKEDEDVQQDATRSEEFVLSNDVQVPPPPRNDQKVTSGVLLQGEQASAFHYLVAAAVIEYENPNIRPYADDILKLVVTLPVDGQTQNVQFDFHLVEDDPVQVAKEMVKELGIPQDAVLEISEIISGLARTARMKQDRHAVRLQNVQTLLPPFQQGFQPSQHSQQCNQQFQHQGVVLAESQPDQTYHQDQTQYQQQSVQPAHYAPHQVVIPGGPTSQDHSNYHQLMQKSLLQAQHSSQQAQHGHHFPGNLTTGGSLMNSDQLHHHQGKHSIPQVQEAVSGGHQLDHSSYQQSVQPASIHVQQMQNQELTTTNESQHEPLQYQHQGTLPPLHTLHRGSPQESPHYQHQGLQHVQQNQVYQVLQSPYHQHLEPPHHHQLKLPQYKHQQKQSAQHSGGPQELEQIELPHAAQATSLPDYPTKAVHSPMQLQPKHRQSGGPEQPIQIQNQPPNCAPSHGGAYAQTFSHGDSSSQQPSHAQVPTHAKSIQIHPQQPIFVSSVINSSSSPPAIVMCSASGQSVDSGGPSAQTPNEPLLANLHDVAPLSVTQPEQLVPLQSTATIQTGFMPPLRLSHVSSFSQQTLVGAEIPPHATKVLENGRSNLNISEHDIYSDQTVLPDSSSQSPIASHRSNSAETLARTSQSTDSQVDACVDGEVDSDAEDISEELRKLDADFQKNLERAKKVFVNRMDNLQRSQIEREAQHLKTLEKHEKERAEFEKRLAHEAEQQHRRIEQLQREWDKRRETVALHKRKQKDDTQACDEQNQDLQSAGPAPPSGHLRNTSIASSNLSTSPAMSSHKFSQDPCAGGPS